MLKDRRVLIEQELVLQKRACGRLYLEIVMGEDSSATKHTYDNMKDKLVDLQAELNIVEQMIADGAE